MTTTLKRVLRLCILLLTLTTFTTVAKRQQYETFEAFDNVTLFAAVSGCELCQQTDQCDQAFQSTLGQFCQTLVSCMTCCCPPDAHCVLDNAYNCRCLRTVVSSNLNVRGETSATSGPVVETLVCILVVASCMCCFSCCCLNNYSQQPVSYAEPVNTTIVYGTNGSAFGGNGGSQTTTPTPSFAGDLCELQVSELLMALLGREGCGLDKRRAYKRASPSTTRATAANKVEDMQT